MPVSVTDQTIACCRASKRLLLLDYDGTLVDQNAIDNKPDAEVLKMVQGLCADPNNFVFIISGRARTELSQWFDPSVRLPVAFFPAVPQPLLLVLNGEVVFNVKLNIKLH